ncbi:MAG: hypothetical protein O9327_02215 [Polaromonas sp.]|nr:hypothetical protein [Polaromonas sp.]
MSLDIELIDADGAVVYSGNITHNLTTMAAEAGIYECLWRPDEHGITTASQVVEPLAAGLDRMSRDQPKYKAFEASNGWGELSDFLLFCAGYLEACRANPTARVEVER